jgi:hypothetical protein
VALLLRILCIIKEYVVIESGVNLVNRVLPETSLAIAFRFSGQIDYIIEGRNNSLPASVISGLRKSPRLINYLVDTGAIVVKFQELTTTRCYSNRFEISLTKKAGMISDHSRFI